MTPARRSELKGARVSDEPLVFKHLRETLGQVIGQRLGTRSIIRLTVMHELGHYFGMDETRLKDV